MTALTYALRLAERRIPSFPCLASKTPTCRHGFHAATADPAALRELWRRHPGELIGVPTGPVSGFDALDIDPRHAGDAWLAAHRDRLPVTRTHTTRSGGLHLLLRRHDGVRNSAGRIAPGIDVRGEGGFIIWWPAAGHPVPVRGPIAPWPAWLLAILMPPPAPRSEPVPMRYDTDDSTVARFLAAALLRVETAPDGERHVRLRGAARSIGGIMQAAGISEVAATEALFAAVRNAGGSAVCERNARATIAWALADGAAHPITLRGRHGR